MLHSKFNFFSTSHFYSRNKSIKLTYFLYLTEFPFFYHFKSLKPLIYPQNHILVSFFSYFSPLISTPTSPITSTDSSCLTVDSSGQDTGVVNKAVLAACQDGTEDQMWNLQDDHLVLASIPTLCLTQVRFGKLSYL